MSKRLDKSFFYLKLMLCSAINGTMIERKEFENYQFKQLREYCTSLQQEGYTRVEHWDPVKHNFPDAFRCIDVLEKYFSLPMRIITIVGLIFATLPTLGILWCFPCIRSAWGGAWHGRIVRQIYMPDINPRNRTAQAVEAVYNTIRELPLTLDEFHKLQIKIAAVNATGERENSDPVQFEFDNKHFEIKLNEPDGLEILLEGKVELEITYPKGGDYSPDVRHFPGQVLFYVSGRQEAVSWCLDPYRERLVRAAKAAVEREAHGRPPISEGPLSILRFKSLQEYLHPKSDHSEAFTYKGSHYRIASRFGTAEQGKICIEDVRGNVLFSLAIVEGKVRCYRHYDNAQLCLDGKQSSILRAALETIESRP